MKMKLDSWSRIELDPIPVRWLASCNGTRDEQARKQATRESRRGMNSSGRRKNIITSTRSLLFAADNGSSTISKSLNYRRTFIIGRKALNLYEQPLL